MMDRRRLNQAIGATALASILPGQALAKPVKPKFAFHDPGKGPWTDSGVLRRAGGVLHYAHLGDKASSQPPVVLLHKLGGWMADWRFVAPEIAKNRHVIAFDLPGHGESHWEGKPPYLQSLAETAALLKGALDEMGVAKIDLIGTSLGGCIGVVFAAYYPERTGKLAIVSSALGGARTLQEIVEAIDVPQRVYFDPETGRPKPFDPSITANLMGVINAEQVTAESNASRDRAGLWIQPSERGVGITDIKGLLTRVESRTLLLYGERKNSYLRFRADAEAALRNSRTEFIPESGAFVMQDNPNATARALIRFLTEG